MYPNSKLFVLGPIGKGTQKIIESNVVYYDRVSEKVMKDVYKMCDIYLHLCKKDSCPSTVVEAISAGVPVITTNACGGAIELCNLTKGCIVVNGEDESLESDYIYQDPYNKIPGNVEADIVSAMDKIIKENVKVKLPDQLKIDYTAKQYLEVFKKLI